MRTQNGEHHITDFIIKKLPCDLTFNAGFALVGQYTVLLGISAVVDCKFPVATAGNPKSGILKSYLACWCKARTTSMQMMSSGAMPSLALSWTLA